MSTQAQEAVKIETVQPVNPDELEHAAGVEHEMLEGWVPTLATDEETRVALEKAFDYRGDITVTKKDGTKLEGYLFDRQTGKGLTDSFVRLLPSTGPVGGSTGARTKITIAYVDIAALAFTGRDNAAGKTFEAWVKKYFEKKAAGEKNIQIEPEKLD
jgi:hypothetical protein